MKPAAFLVTDPEGARTRVELLDLPFHIGRHASNDLVLRDARASRKHAQVIRAGDDLVLVDLDSRHGVIVNGAATKRHILRPGDRIEFGIPDSYTLQFEAAGETLQHLTQMMPRFEVNESAGHLSKLRAVLEVARSLQASFSADEVLTAVVDAALIITNAERGFLLLDVNGELEVRCARDAAGGPLRDTDLRVPRKLLSEALAQKAGMLSVQFDPNAAVDPNSTIAALELRSAVCIRLVRVQLGHNAREAGQPQRETIGVLYLDSRMQRRDLAAGNQELLETLAIEASTVLENARLIEEERARQRLEEELTVARGIQQNLLPRELPETGWFRACGLSRPTHQVGGDYYDVFEVNPNCWAMVLADVSGKGVSSALVASLLQGAFMAMEDSPQSILRTFNRVNRFLSERSDGGKYATIFCAMLDAQGNFTYSNAGHCPALLVPLHGALEWLEATSMPVGLLHDTAFEIARRKLDPGDRIVTYSDGVTDGANAVDEHFGRRRLKEVVRANADRPCSLLHQAVFAQFESFTQGCEQDDDVTLVVLEYRPG